MTMGRGGGLRTLLFAVVLIFVVTAGGTLDGTSESRTTRQTQNATARETQQDHGGGHHGVRLASWRWDEYSTIVIITSMVIIAGVLKLAFHHTPILSKHLPESCVLIIIGVIIGVIVYYGVESHSHHFPNFTAELFFNVLLPPIILDSAYALYDRDFLSNFGSILLYAVIGTLFNVFAIGGLLYLLYYIGAMGSFNTTLDAISLLTFSSLISAVDPVAVLAIFEEIGVNMELYFLVFGESLLNDGVTVVLYNTMLALGGQETIDYTQYILAFFSFFTVVFGGLGVGVIVGALSAFILKFTTHVRVIEPLIIFSTAYFAFIMAECIHWSGIISLIGCGVAQKRYALPNASKKSYTTVKYSVKTMASFCDCIIFLFLGIVTISHQLEWHTGFVLWTIVLCFAIRFVGVFGLTYLINLRRLKPISYKEQFIMAYGGLRGAVGFSLVTILPDSDPMKNIFLTTTIVMIIFTVFVQGGTIKFLVGKLKITRKSNEAKTVSKDVNLKTIDHVMAGIESVTGHSSRYTAMEKVRNFDHRYVKKNLIRKDAEDLLALRARKITLDEHYARLYGPSIMAHNSSNATTTTTTDELPAYTDEERRKLKMALSDTPFERYRHKAYNKVSPEHVRNQLQRDHQERMHLLEKRLFFARQAEERAEAAEQKPKKSGEDTASVTSESSIGDDGHGGGDGGGGERNGGSGGAAGGGENDFTSVKTRLLWQKAGLSAVSIKKQYDEAKEEYKGRKMSVMRSTTQ